MRLLRGLFVVSALLAVAADPPAPGAPGAPKPVVSSTFTPVADSYVDANLPTTNFGAKTYVYNDGSPQRTAYLKFDVQGVTDFTQATLMLYAESASSTGVEVHPVADSTWGETTINASNGPPVGASLASSGGFASGSWVAIDVTSAVQANGLVTLATTTTSSTAIKVTSREGANQPELIVGPAPPNPSPFVISPAGGGTYQATSATAGTVYTGTLKFVGERAVTDLQGFGGGTVSFTAGDFDFGTEFFKLSNVVDIVFEGAGIDTTVLRNSTNAAADTEPFNFTTATRITIRDLTVAAGGSARTTSDAIDMDNGNDSTIERVKITASRGRGVVFDGKNAGWDARNNMLRDCVITGTQWHGVELLAASNNRIESCTITTTAGSGIQVNKSSTNADQPNKKSSDNVITGNIVDQAGRDGIAVNGGDRNQITGNTVTNSSDDVTGRDGIRIGSTNSVSCDDNTVSGNVATDDQVPKTQRYGVNIATALCNRTVVGPGNNLDGNRVGPLNDAGTGTILQ
ncbi:MAG: DUF7594 domain-containing protein [Pseudonocardia sp.]